MDVAEIEFIYVYDENIHLNYEINIVFFFSTDLISAHNESSKTEGVYYLANLIVFKAL